MNGCHHSDIHCRFSNSYLDVIGITSPENNEPYEKESTEANRKLVEGKEVKLEYDNYKGDKQNKLGIWSK